VLGWTFKDLVVGFEVILLFDSIASQVIFHFCIIFVLEVECYDWLQVQYFWWWIEFVGGFGFFFSHSWTKNKFKSCGVVLVLLDAEWFERTCFRRGFGYLHAHLYEYSWTSTWLPGKCCLIFLLSSDYIGPIIILLILGPAVHKWITSCQLYDRRILGPAVHKWIK